MEYFTLLRYLLLLLIILSVLIPMQNRNGDSATVSVAQIQASLPPSFPPQPTPKNQLTWGERVFRGLEYLAYKHEVEQLSDGTWIGYWRNDVGYKTGMSYSASNTNAKHVGITAIACLAFMANGHYPGRGEYGQIVETCLNFVLHALDQSSVRGFITYDGSRMYSHAFAALFLAEAYGMRNRGHRLEEALRQQLMTSIRLIITSQNNQGGWRYAPYAVDSDISIAVSQLQALRAVANVGFSIPPYTMERAEFYVDRSYNPIDGVFYYTIDDGRPSRFNWTLTSAGVVAMQQFGHYFEIQQRNGRSLPLEPAYDFIKRGHSMSHYSTNWTPTLDYYYGYYYATQAMYQYSRRDEDIWVEWKQHLDRAVAVRQNLNDGGYWSDNVGKNYATAMATLILSMDNELLPILQK